jgi:hypothetical protein
MVATRLRRSVTLQIAQFAGLCSLDIEAYDPTGCRCSDGAIRPGYTTVEVQMPKEKEF